MMNIIIEDNYKFFRQGVEAVIMQLANKHGKNATISYELNSNQVSYADVIIKSVLGCELNMCHVMPCKRHRRCVVILIVDVADLVKNFKRALCLSQAVIIDRTITPEMLEGILSRCWNEIAYSKFTMINHCFESCSPFTMGGSQLNISRLLYNGFSIKEIAAKLNMNTKTVYTHKYNLMKAVNLDSTYDLYRFLRFYHDKYGLFRHAEGVIANNDLI